MSLFPFDTSHIGGNHHSVTLSTAHHQSFNAHATSSYYWRRETDYVDGDALALAEWRRQCAMIQAMAPVADERGVVRMGRPMNLHRFDMNPVRFARSKPPPKYSFYQGDF